MLSTLSYNTFIKRIYNTRFRFHGSNKKMRILVKIKTLKLCVHPLMCIVDEKKKKKLATKRNRVCKCIRSVASFFFFINIPYSNEFIGAREFP